VSAGRRYLLFLAALAGVTVLVLAAGYRPTRALAGEAALEAMFLACGVCLAGSAVGGVPIALARAGGPEALKRFIGSMALRLAVVALLALLVLLLLAPARKPFLLWLALSHLVLLVADTGFAWRVLGRL
jgi:hypothetical protein